MAASCSSSLRCSRVSLRGVIACTVTSRSPRPRPGDVRHAFAAEPEYRAGRGAFRDFQRLRLARDARHLDLAAEGQGREVHRNLAGEIVAVAVKERVLLDADDDVEIAGRPALRARFALAGEPQPLPGGDARREP